MAAENLPLVVVLSDSPLPALTHPLWQVEIRTLGSEAAALPWGSVLVIDGRTDLRRALSSCKMIHAASGETSPPTLLLVANASESRRSALDHGADVCLSEPLDDEELRAQVRALLRQAQGQERLRNRAEDAKLANQRLQQANAQINRDLELARRLQASFLPRQLPEIGQVRFAVYARPLDQVGGDFFDVFRLDERRVGFYLADVMGHGLPAGLLTIYLKRAVAPKEIVPGGYRLVAPHEVLAQLNRDLIEQDLPEQPFITMIYGVIDTFTGDLQLARAAHPYPIHIPQEGPPEIWKLFGTVLGVFEADYRMEQKTLKPGDKILFVTDGLTADLPDPQNPEHEALLEAVTEARELPAKRFVDRVAERLLAKARIRDDITLLALEYAN